MWFSAVVGAVHARTWQSRDCSPTVGWVRGHHDAVMPSETVVIADVTLECCNEVCEHADFLQTVSLLRSSVWWSGVWFELS